MARQIQLAWQAQQRPYCFKLAGPKLNSPEREAARRRAPSLSLVKI